MPDLVRLTQTQEGHRGPCSTSRDRILDRLRFAAAAIGSSTAFFRSARRAVLCSSIREKRIENLRGSVLRSRASLSSRPVGVGNLGPKWHQCIADDRHLVKVAGEQALEQVINLARVVVQERQPVSELRTRVDIRLLRQLTQASSVNPARIALELAQHLRDSFDLDVEKRR